MEQIVSCALFVGADSWAKTFSALVGLPTYVFDAIKGGDWRGVKDPSDFVFLDPWDCLQVVSGLDALRDCLTRDQHRAQQPTPEAGGSRTAHVAFRLPGITRMTLRTIASGASSAGLIIQRCSGTLAMRTVPIC